MRGKNPKCTQATSSFECLSAGIFPDPLDCKKYYNCLVNSEGELIADGYECDNFYVFDPSSVGNDFCRLTFNRFCVQAECTGNVKNVLLNYLNTKVQFVATCRNGKKPLVSKCEEGFVADLKTLPVECNVNCLGPSKFENRDDPTKYFDCIYTDLGWKATLKNCFRNYSFDKDVKACVFNPTTKKRE
jgi:hypothetical protein